jgi:UrcA family protein
MSISIAKAALVSAGALIGATALAGAASAQSYTYDAYGRPIYSQPYDPAYAPPPAYSPPSYSTPAYSDAYAGGVTVYGRAPRDLDELSQTVSFRDLDLTTRAGVDQLRWRIRNAAEALCGSLGEGREYEQNTAVLPSCQAAARDRAEFQVRRAVDYARYWGIHPALPAETQTAAPYYGSP